MTYICDEDNGFEYDIPEGDLFKRLPSWISPRPKDLEFPEINTLGLKSMKAVIKELNRRHELEKKSTAAKWDRKYFYGKRGLLI